MWMLMQDDTSQEEDVSAAFNILKEAADVQNVRLGKLISTVMDDYKSRHTVMTTQHNNDRNYYRINKILSFGENTLQKAAPPKYTSDMDKTKYLLTFAKHIESSFREQVMSVIDALNGADTYKAVTERFEVSPEAFDATDKNNQYRNPEFLLDPAEPRKVVDERFGPPKGFERALAKMTSKSELKDLNRATLTFEDPRIMELAYYIIMMRFTVVQVKNKHNLETFDQPPNIHMNISLDDGWICELQLIFKKCLTIKKELHNYYDISRAKDPLEIGSPPFQEEDEKKPAEKLVIENELAGLLEEVALDDITWESVGGEVMKLNPNRTEVEEAERRRAQAALAWMKKEERIIAEGPEAAASAGGGEKKGQPSAEVWEQLKEEVGLGHEDQTMTTEAFVGAVDGVFFDYDGVSDEDTLVKLVDTTKAGLVAEGDFADFYDGWKRSLVHCDSLEKYLMDVVEQRQKAVKEGSNPELSWTMLKQEASCQGSTIPSDQFVSAFRAVFFEDTTQEECEERAVTFLVNTKIDASKSGHVTKGDFKRFLKTWKSSRRPMPEYVNAVFEEEEKRKLFLAV
jgi:hypothetical protein